MRIWNLNLLKLMKIIPFQRPFQLPVFDADLRRANNNHLLHPPTEV